MEQGLFAVCKDEAMQGQTVLCRAKACFLAACNIHEKVDAGAMWSRGFSQCAGMT